MPAALQRVFPVLFPLASQQPPRASFLSDFLNMDILVKMMKTEMKKLSRRYYLYNRILKLLFLNYSMKLDEYIQ